MTPSADTMASSSSFSSWEDLPDDLWEKIFDRVDHGFRDATLRHVSLVCKRFLCLSNRIRTSFFIYEQRKPVPIKPLIARFTFLNRISFWGRDPNLDVTLTQLAMSGLALRRLDLCNRDRLPTLGLLCIGFKMKRTLRSLSCTDFAIMCDQDLAFIAEWFPYLHELDIEAAPIPAGKSPIYRITDKGVLVIATKLRSLLSFNILYHDRLTHKSFEHLALNSSSLRNLSMVFDGYDCKTCVNSFRSFKCLTSVTLLGRKISKSVFVQLSEISSKLVKLSLDYNEITYDIDGVFLCAFLKSLQFLQCLKFGFHFPFPSDLNSKDFALSIPNIQDLQLLCKPGRRTPFPSGCLFYLLHGCPLLEYIALACEYIHGRVEDLAKLTAHRRMHHLSFNVCKDLTDETLSLLVCACPWLKSLEITCCSGFTEKGIEAIIAKSNNMEIVNVSNCRGVPDMRVVI